MLISLLREASEHNAKLKEDTLEFLLDLFTEVKPLSLWGTSQIDIVLDKSLHTVANYLEEVIVSDKTGPVAKNRALKVLFSLGMLRGSLPNLLSVVNIQRRLNLTTDLSAEMRLLSEAKADSHLEFEGKIKAQTKVFFRSAVPADAKAGDKHTYLTLTSDGRYIYIHSEVEGLLKVGSGHGHTMLGKVYKHISDYRLKERGTLAYVLGHLYFRSQRISPAPLIEIDPDTLEELPGPVAYDTVCPNSLYPELSNPEIEFPHDATHRTEAEKLVGSPTTPNPGAQRSTAPKKDGPSKRDLRLLRPAQRSPMFTEGRYIYLVSQWTVEARQRSGDSDDEEEGDSGEIRQARFGVDIYDPLSDFEHVRSVELLAAPKQKGPKDKSKQPTALGVKTLDQGSFITNGTWLAVIVPPGVEEGTELKIKYFDLKDGRLLSTSTPKEKSFIYFSYDHANNVVWGISETKKTFESIAAFSNETVPEKFSFDEDDEEFYQPCDNKRIIEIAKESLGFDEEGETTLDGRRAEKASEELQTLLSLGFEVSTSELQAKSRIGGQTSSAAQPEYASKATQLFILANIARLGESFASLDYQRNDYTDRAPNLESYRKPYCVHLLPKVFTYLEDCLEANAHSFFDVKESAITDETLLGQYSLLVTLRILKYNLAAAELFSEHMKKADVELPPQRFALRLRDLVFQILDSRPYETKEYEDLSLIHI
eukprot:TRINITY_DN13068_c0_g1_i2.p1 TRINITY_DN13068_c0_g1~~TRINITY_DN13068_c0_g1_i2.p1  ORF type:complete len:708 (+),score=213.28 TRINITY_DN13068_c0_g1_i2:188-2311(+)